MLMLTAGLFIATGALAQGDPGGGCPPGGGGSGGPPEGMRSGPHVAAEDIAMEGQLSLYLDNDFRNLWLDVRMVRAHVANNPVGFARNYATILMGGQNNDQFI